MMLLNQGKILISHRETLSLVAFAHMKKVREITCQTENPQDGFLLPLSNRVGSGQREPTA
jgi:hypothetical protein